MIRVSMILLLLGWAGVASGEDALFPFVISYDAPDNVTNVSAWLDSPAGRHGFVRNEDGHFATDAGPIRFWGTNLCGDGCFPTHEQAERLAARLARLGVNCVRMHHMDNQAIWGDSPNKLIIDPKQLERLDYLVYQLKLRGVYTNLNLHVSRWFDVAEGFNDRDRRPMFDKGIDQIETRMVELQKRFARDLLTHVNPYTKTAYTDEPAIAFVEISNEDGLFCEWSSCQLDCLPEPYATNLRKLWNTWLRSKYGSSDSLRVAWGAGATAELGEEMLRNGDFSQPLDGTWNVERDAQTKAEVSIQAEGTSQLLRVSVADPGQAVWNPQVTQSGLRVKKGNTYTLSFRLRCDKPRQCEVLCQMAHEPWKHLGLSGRVKAGPEWSEHHITFAAMADDDNARIAFSKFQSGVVFQLGDVSLRPGGIVGLEANTRLEDDSVPTPPGVAMISSASADFCDFLSDTERNYWASMKRFLKEDLHARSLVCGTQLGFSTMHNQSEMDYIDNHAYWQHPTFPNRQWDMDDWFIEDIPLVNNPGGTLAHLAMGRVAGKAYTVTEYNQPAPNSYAGEGFPMIASFGAYQDWNGIYSFDYSANSSFEPRRIESFFDIKSHTAQLVHMPACAAMFLRGDVAAATKSSVFRLSREDERQQLHEIRSAWSLRAPEFLHDLWYSLLHATALDLSDPTGNDSGECTEVKEGLDALAAGRFVTDSGQICWDITQKEAGYYTVDTVRSKLFTGFVRGRRFSLGNVTLQIGPTRLDWATISMTAIDGKGFDQPGRILIAATGVVQNRDADLQRLDGNKATLQNHWGSEPVLCEGIPAKITLPIKARQVQCYPLDELGNRREAIPVTQVDDRAQIEIGPECRTVWYEVEIVAP